MNGLTRYYSVLERTPSDGIDMIKSSYRQLAKQFHLDISARDSIHSPLSFGNPNQ